MVSYDSEDAGIKVYDSEAGTFQLPRQTVLTRYDKKLV